MSEITKDEFGAVEKTPFIGIRKSIAKRLKMTTTAVAMVTHFDFADVTEVATLRAEMKASGKAISYMPFIIKAVTNALSEEQHKIINSELDEENGSILFKRYFNVGIAVDTERGLMVPVIQHADKLSLEELGQSLSSIAERARSRTIKLEEMRGGTFTISNVGAVGGAFSTPIMNYPQAAILGLGKITDEAMVKNGQIVIGKRLPLFLSFDHRLIDGADAGRFLNAIIASLAEPKNLMK
ncbi:MAG: hypothetical protein COX62_02905 [Deltaproteobacteria bacterium CG_4_10_14_0_2_um_filter_43_8]|nr:MAG: hypothetical protein COV43_06460 [Deltaproteobacteria bacterium CG11_big_fil_rev_8_21_14_0_20_42_23]PJA21237.1 MAG: hypothetical protein COX62_02905 [Deltaproteobacteria bacterium CG_4_10_14_0_2_um_filter_43_8]PJC64068.1 MAG: hypothetical protein CO021_06155 [Deltaproteobacteria bacterium CG_4_9_14_0_2_um_filter_42_21]